MRIAIAIAAVAAVFASPAAATPARIAFSSNAHLWTMNADGSGAARVPWHGGPRTAYEPRWSPDGSRLAFVSSGRRIWTVGVDGSHPHRLSPKGLKRTSDVSPAWSPDGTRIAFTRTRYGPNKARSSVIVADADGSHGGTAITRTFRQLGGFSAVTFAPDGQRLAVTRTLLDKHSYFQPSLVSMALDGSDRHLLARGGSDASFSPDGTRIAFVSIRDHNGDDCGDECEYRGEVYVMNADGSGQTRLTNDKGDASRVDWSPDGGRIAFASSRNYPSGGQREVYSVAPDGKCLTWLTNGNVYSQDPSWEPGATLSSDPGECGAVDRPARVISPAPRVEPTFFKPLWLGARFGANLLSQRDSNRGDAAFYYGDCSSFTPSGCGPATQLQERSTCAQYHQEYSTRLLRRLRARHGALVLDRRQGYDVYTGSVAIDLYDPGPRGLDGVLEQLRPVRAAAPSRTLPPPVFPARVWRRADAATRARFRAAGARRKHCAPGDHEHY